MQHLWEIAMFCRQKRYIYIRQVNHEVKFSFSFLFKCKAGADKKTVFELEICRVPYMDNVVGKCSGFVFYCV